MGRRLSAILMSVIIFITSSASVFAADLDHSITSEDSYVEEIGEVIEVENQSEMELVESTEEPINDDYEISENETDKTLQEEVDSSFAEELEEEIESQIESDEELVGNISESEVVAKLNNLMSQYVGSK